ncbi:uncharacterized protein B0P05DRAFT_521208 [Gilbertella persicaria]|uniref:uncharacterized protein n=1 Tax=Gilbertella persicaria TaxID=101096 RepID=UPI00221FB12E|nr:uncharacterized protein B0P05DRAFT_521208 [Gilbertella persicaria]KAI8098280.1 hypothetical protein B0P05DRAFT_521208 [Gilbertella persicaria]
MLVIFSLFVVVVVFSSFVVVVAWSWFEDVVTGRAVVCFVVLLALDSSFAVDDSFLVVLDFSAVVDLCLVTIDRAFNALDNEVVIDL